jgi:O-antigen ligase
VKFVIHFLFLAAAVAWLYRRNTRYYWRALGWFCGGLAVNAAYGVVQLLVARSGGNLDSWLVSPLTGGASSINIYGAVEGASVYRPNALTGDPNHLAIMLLVPLLVLTPIYLRLGAGHRLRLRLGLLISFLLVVEVSTLSRSGLLGLGVGALVLALPYRHYLRSRALLLPLAGAVTVLGAVVLSRLDFFSVVIRSRLQTGGGGASIHLQVYDFVPQILHSHPLLGLGLFNFSVYYELVTGKTNWGPHSYYVALMVETGLIGTALFALFIL